MKRSILLIFLVAIVLFGSCAGKKGKGGTKQPKKGPIPCPMKDC